MTPIEYLFVDEKRLNSYFEQISSPVMYDKVPVWNAGLSLTGPKAEGTQARFARPFTVHEKITELTQYLEKEKLIGIGRSRGMDEIRELSYKGARNNPVKDFRMETCYAKKVFIPSKVGQTSKSDDVRLWVSPKNSIIGGAETQSRKEYQLKIGNLYLLEDYTHGDETPRVWSSYSFLELVLEEKADEMRNSILGSAIESKESRKLLRAFSIDPFSVLSQLGAQVGPERIIQTLYRVRTTFMDGDSKPKFCIATFGYPIFVAAINRI